MLLLALCTPMFLQAQIAKLNAKNVNSPISRYVQPKASGINWTAGLSLSQILEKAKQENKYVFFDVFATWCGPCKQMDKEVYTNDTVSDFFNKNFIAVKVQMDKTAKDDENVKKWYADADSLAKKYLVEGYPTFIFLSPQGEIVHKDIGFKTAAEFVALGQLATQPGKTYEDSYAKYKRLMEAYKAGERNYDQYVFMIQTAEKLQDNDTRKTLTREFADHLATLPRDQRYTKDIIELWSRHAFNPKHPVFGFYRDDADLIDKVMDREGYAMVMLDASVQTSAIDPFFAEQAKQNPNATEADWSKLEKLLKETYADKIARRNLLAAHSQWYYSHGNPNEGLKYDLMKLNEFPLTHPTWLWRINNMTWDAFVRCTDQKLLKECAKWMDKAATTWPDRTYYLDTYASILYKIGQKDKAIAYETKAIKQEKDNKDYQAVLALMKVNRPIYTDAGANWEGTNGINWNGFVFEKVVFVRKDEKTPLVGVTITNKRTNESVTTTPKGVGKINVMLGDELVVSNSGFASQEFKVTKNCDAIRPILKAAN